MDAFTANHLQVWLDRFVFEGDRFKVWSDITAYLREYPEQLETGRSWPELRDISEGMGSE